jgi:hypothetical protein
MQYRWLNQRSHSTSRQGAFLTQRHNIARKTIDGFEKKFKVEEKRVKGVTTYNKEVVAEHKQKFSKIHDDHKKVFEKQQITKEKQYSQSNSSYHKLLKETKARLEYKREIEVLRSVSH